MSLWLTEDELVELTGYRHRNKQRLALSTMGIQFRTRPADGFPLVDRWQFEQEGSLASKRPRSAEPNWDAVRQFSKPKGPKRA